MVHAYYPPGDKSTDTPRCEGTIVRRRLVQVHHGAPWSGAYYRGGG